MENEQHDASSEPIKDQTASQQTLQNLSEDELQQIESQIIKRSAAQFAPGSRPPEMMHERNASVVSTRVGGKRRDAHERSSRTDSKGINQSLFDKDPHDKDPHDKDPGNFDRNNFDRNNFDRH